MRAAKWAGMLYITASVGFLIVFAWLAQQFDYPDILSRDAAVVLPRLHALGNDGRVIWGLYALLPLLLIPAVAGAAETWRATDRTHTDPTAWLGRLVVSLQSLAALCMTAGLIRWCTSHWALAEAWERSDASTQQAIRVFFDAGNLLLGTAIGEFVGEVALYGSFIVLARLLHQRGAVRLSVLAAVAGVTGSIGLWRNVTPHVQLAADVSNVLLPLFLIVYGVSLLRDGSRERA